MESAMAQLRQPVVGPVPVGLLTAAGVITRANTTRQIIAFTFDFDMTPNMLERLRAGRVKAWYDPEVLRVLESEQVPSTFFVTGLAAIAYPDLMHSLVKNPLVEIGNHSNRHFAFAPRCYTLPTIPDRDDVAEVEAAQQHIREATGITTEYFRFPGGCYEPSDVEIITHMGLTIVHWDVVSTDAFNPNGAVIVRRVIAQTRPGSIVLFHVGGPNAPQTASALKALIPYFKAQGYTFVTISQLLKPES
jgi:peptidoglycan/xylan/chitin deacetylase (PgdA/CDA1 family)